MAQEMNLACNHEATGLIPALARGLRIEHCHELWCSWKMWATVLHGCSIGQQLKLWFDP